MVQWLRLCASTQQGCGSIPDWGTKIPLAWWPKQTNQKKPQITVKTILSLQTTQTRQPRYIPQAGVWYTSLARMNPTDFLQIWRIYTKHLTSTRQKCPGHGTSHGGPVVKNLPSDTGDVGLIPGWGTKMPCAVGQLSLHTTTRESTCCNKDPAQPKKRKRRPRSWQTWKDSETVTGQRRLKGDDGEMWSRILVFWIRKKKGC